MRKTTPNIQQIAKIKVYYVRSILGSKKGMQDSGLSHAFQLYYKAAPKV